MNECDNCGSSVDIRWKFCLSCGHRMTPASAEQAFADAAFAEALDEMGDDPEPPHAGSGRMTFDWQLTLGVILALVGVAMIIYLVVALIAPH